MPPRPPRRPVDPDAGPAIVDDRAPLEVVPAQPANVEPRSAPEVTATPAVKPRKFTALVDAETDARFGQLLDRLRRAAGPVATRADGNGRTRSGYDLSRADLLRALLVVAEQDPAVMHAVQAQAVAHYGQNG